MGAARDRLAAATPHEDDKDQERFNALLDDFRAEVLREAADVARANNAWETARQFVAEATGLEMGAWVVLVANAQDSPDAA